MRQLFLLCLLATGLSACGQLRDTHELLNGVLWMQTSAEYRVLAQLAYAQAEAALDKALADPTWTAAVEQTEDFRNLPPAIILDLDETVLDNTGFDGGLIRDKTPYSRDRWERWIKQANAPAVPGALDFLEYAKAKGVIIFFVTNRSHKHEEFTRLNLLRLGVALPSGIDTVLSVGEEPYDWPANKTTRRLFLAKHFRVLLLIGDDLEDFVSMEGTVPSERRRIADSHRTRWGTSWLLIPNPLYGSWETALYPPTLPDHAILERKKSLLHTGKPDESPLP